MRTTVINTRAITSAISGFHSSSAPGVFYTYCISITTPIVSALKNYYRQGFLEVPTDFLSHFWIQVAVSEFKRPLRNRFGIETVTNL
jgi:hypothetical protein